MTRTIADAPVGARVVLEAVEGPLGIRLAELGLVRGVEVQIVQAIPLGGPILLERQGFVLALRRGDARSIQVREGRP